MRMENNSNIVEKNTATGVCKGCGWQCPLDKLSCNKGRRLNGVAEVVEEIKAKRPALNPRTERFLRRLNREDNVVQGGNGEQNK